VSFSIESKRYLENNDIYVTGFSIYSSYKHCKLFKCCLRMDAEFEKKLRNEFPDVIKNLEFAENSLDWYQFDYRLSLLIKLMVARQNKCETSRSLYTAEALSEGETVSRINDIMNWKESGHYSDSEKAAFSLVECMSSKVNSIDISTSHQWSIEKYYSGRQIRLIVLIVTMEEFWARISQFSERALPN
jgi:hypothetical protein